MEASLPRIECTTSSDTYARFEVEPLERGYGVTLGNALRRVLLSSLPGAAITAVQIDGIRHEFSDVPGVKEDVTELILNLKKVRMRSFSDEPVHLALDVQGEGKVTAGSIRATDLVEVVNPDQHIATLDSANARLTAEVVVERGRGYHDITDQREEVPIGRIPVDGIFSPVERVNYTIEHTRVGQMTNFEHLILEVWTDGTITPNDAVSQAASLLTQHFQHLAGFGQEIVIPGGKQPLTNRPLPTQEAEMPVEDLNLSARAENSLKRAGITKVGQLVNMNPEDLMSIRNFGQKSYHELIDRLKLRKLVPEDSPVLAIEGFEEE
ncbi:MAG: DNA-directed RNA polymerase subunit alpha [Chloroflexota bacterium]